MGLTRYPSYKPSGIEWIGEIPSHWEIRPVKHFLRKGKEGIRIGPFGSSLRSEFIRVEGYKVYGQENIINNSFEVGWRFIDKEKFDELSEYEVGSGDILVTMMGTTGKSKVVPKGIERGIMDSHLIRMRIEESLFRPELLSELINSSYYFFVQMKLQSKGSIMEGLNSSIVKNLLVVTPPLTEQTAIAAYLDEKTAQIDQLIAAKRRMIELLKEERMAIINEAVSGEGKKGWERKKISHGFTRIGSGTTPAAGSLIYYDGKINWLQTGDLNDGTIENTSRTITEQALKDFTTLRVYPKGSLVIAMYGATIGKLGILGVETTTNQACCVMSNPTSLETKFVFYWFLSQKEQVLSMAYGGGQPNISQELIRSIRIPCPAIDEQAKIVTEIESKLKDHDQTTSKILREIDLLNEYRSSLINEVVTGKFKVV